MNTLLQAIEDTYVASVPSALQNADVPERISGVFIPYFAWDCYPEDHAENGAKMFLIPESYFRIRGHNPDAITYGYAWPSIVELPSTSIGNPTLQDLLLQWYNFQNNAPMGDASVLSQIGNAVTAACRRLNAMTWPLDRFTEDFVVFSQCMADQSTAYGIKASVQPQWLEQMQERGLFQSWIT